MQPAPRDNPPQSSRSVSIIGTGSYVPDRVLTNSDLESMVETSNEWIIERTGISERRIAAETEFTSHMAAKAAQAALENAGVQPAEVDLILVGTITPDTVFPSTACHVQRRIGAVNAACMDVNAACSGFLYCLEIAHRFIASGACKTALVIGADKLSTIVNWSDRNTCVLFGDGAGAAVLRHRPGSRGIIATHMGSDGNYADILHMPGGGCALPITRENIDEKLNTLQMNGRETFKQAVTYMMRAANIVLDRCGLTTQQIKCVIPHQANIRIIEAMADRMDLPLEKFHINLEKYGNTSAAAVAIALDEAARTGRFSVGDPILLVVFGGGLTYASSVIEW
ncbi:MAG: beta-ketoacyl-ACP synthase III [Terrimicrobiaceae bacterium]|jgi:3-oxoacyl-[acyl-carrier-protein] synthase-3